MKIKIDSIKLRDGVLNVHGWAIGKSKDSSIDYKLLGEDNKSLDIELVKRRRDDVSHIYFGEISEKDFGFDINFDYDANKRSVQSGNCKGGIFIFEKTRLKGDAS